MQSKTDTDLGRMGKNEKGECMKGKGDERREKGEGEAEQKRM